MTNTYTQHTRIRPAPTVATGQSEPIPGTNQVPNSAGGFVWAVDDWTRLDRFLVLGTEGGTYYVSEKELTIDNADAVKRCIVTDGLRTVDRIVEISEAGRAPKNDAAIFALALCSALGNDATRKAALDALPRVARIGTHLFQFIAALEGFRGWGRGARRAVANWYTVKKPDQLAYQLVKYQQRNGWGHRDAIRLSHPKPATDAHKAAFAWTVGKPYEGAPRLINVYEEMLRATTEGQVIDLITRERLTWEFVPANWLGSKDVWQTLLPNLPLMALVRNLGRMTANGAVGAMSDTSNIVNRLHDQEAIHKARVHPIAFLAALATYAQGHGERGKLTWIPVGRIADALNDAFYLAFGNVEPTGKRHLLGIDVSGSMTIGAIAGIPGLTPRMGAAAMALVTETTEPKNLVMGFSHDFMPLSITAKMRLDQVERMMDNMPYGATDCALPMQWALKNKVEVDVFVVYTDNETWAGGQHPVEALREYRRKTGIPAKLIVVAMTSTGFSIADPNDVGMLDIVGMDTATPSLLADFVR